MTIVQVCIGSQWKRHIVFLVTFYRLVWDNFDLDLHLDLDLDGDDDDTGEGRGGGSDEQRGGDRGGRPQTPHGGGHHLQHDHQHCPS